MGIFRRRAAGEALPAAIAGVKLADRVFFAGTDAIALAADVAARAGLTGRVVSFADDADAARTRTARIEAAGALAEAGSGSLTSLPFDPSSFDVAIAEERLLTLDPADRQAAIGELFRVLRPGGRLLWIERQSRRLWPGLGSRSDADIETATRERMLAEAGFRGARTLAAAGGRIYIEGIKPAQN